mmetsp:Transcript_8391/g.23645  ORF Transcript_8391/g.23645 Transcript_8391/m.23645 type:complete len:205 (+) Transcript_8391:333-947(+)
MAVPAPPKNVASEENASSNPTAPCGGLEGGSALKASSNPNAGVACAAGAGWVAATAEDGLLGWKAASPSKEPLAAGAGLLKASPSDAPTEEKKSPAGAPEPAATAGVLEGTAVKSEAGSPCMVSRAPWGGSLGVDALLWKDAGPEGVLLAPDTPDPGIPPPTPLLCGHSTAGCGVSPKERTTVKPASWKSKSRSLAPAAASARH